MKNKTICSLVLCLTVNAGCTSIPLIGFNEHKVVPGVYRSGQLNKSRLEEYIKINKISHYINLRGTFEGSDEEKNICEKNNVQYHEFTFSASEYPEKDQVLKLVDLFMKLKDSGENFSFHCMAGADRASFAEALWHVVNNRPVEESIDFSYKLSYGHIEWKNFEKPKNFLRMYKPYKNTKTLREWIIEGYEKPE